jgi:4-hydroxy-tetrahydrodipicolinate synthase
MVTPFQENGEVDYEQAKKLAKALLKSGSDGVVVVGTTGESPTVTWEEEYRLFKEIKATRTNAPAKGGETAPMISRCALVTHRLNQVRL